MYIHKYKYPHTLYIHIDAQDYNACVQNMNAPDHSLSLCLSGQSQGNAKLCFPVVFCCMSACLEEL